MGEMVVDVKFSGGSRHNRLAINHVLFLHGIRNEFPEIIRHLKEIIALKIIEIRQSKRVTTDLFSLKILFTQSHLALLNGSNESHV